MSRNFTVPPWISICLLLSSNLSGCASLVKQQQAANQSEVYRAEAWNLSEKHHYGLALSKIKLAIKESELLPVGSFQAIEAYDDAGLYYYNIEDFRNCAYHQSVAVLLSYKNRASRKMFDVYLERLGWAFSKYSPDYNFELIRNNPLNLLSLTELQLKTNHMIKNKYYRRKNLHPKFHHKRYAMKPEWLK